MTMHQNRYAEGVHEYDVLMTVTTPAGRVLNDAEHSAVWARTEKQARVNALDETWNAYMGDVLIEVKSVTRL